MYGEAGRLSPLIPTGSACSVCDDTSQCANCPTPFPWEQGEGVADSSHPWDVNRIVRTRTGWAPAGPSHDDVAVFPGPTLIGYLQPFAYGLAFLFLLWACMALWSLPHIWLYCVGSIGGPIGAGVCICHIAEVRDGRARSEVGEWIREAVSEIVAGVAGITKRHGK